MKNIFINNKYKRWYDLIILKAQLRTDKLEYNENHHIIPRSLGGNNDSSNLVTLTGREHFICHILLTKFTVGLSKHKMLYAANIMSQASRDYQDRYIPSSRLYEMIKKEFSRMHSEKMSGRKLSVEHRAKIAASGRGRVFSAETIQKRAAKNTGKKRTPEQKERMRQSQLNRKEKTLEEKKAIALKISQKKLGIPLGSKSELHKEKLSKAMIGRNVGIPKTEETKQKMRKPKSEAHCKAISEGRKAKFALLRNK
jgi:hypothetical protein